MTTKAKKMKQPCSIKKLTLLFIGFWAFFLICMSLEQPTNKILCNKNLSTWTITDAWNAKGAVFDAPLCSELIISADPYHRPKGEFTVPEQLSKFYLFLIILISAYAYQVLKKPLEIKTSIGLFTLGLTMYLSESNMISNAPQLLFAAIIVPFTFYQLAKNKAWMTISLICLGFLIISGGILTDFIHQYPNITSYIPAQIPSLLETIGEEKFDVIGIAVLCLSVIFHFLKPLGGFVKNNIRGTFCTIISAGLITSGNGLIHYEYFPGQKLQLLAFSLSLSGWIGLMLTNKYVGKKDTALYILNKEYFYTFIFLFFVMLPLICGIRHYTLISFILWFPLLTFIAVNLYYKHPAIKQH